MILKGKSSLVFFLILTTTLFSSCLSLSTMQSGRTLGKDNSEIVLTGSLGRTSQNSVLVNDSNYDFLPIIAIRKQYGFSQKLDIGLRVDQNTFLGPNIKYQFIGDNKSRFGSSIGLETRFNFFAFLFGNFTYYLTVPLYLSYHPKDNISVYLTPRYLNTSEYIFNKQSSSPGAGDSFTQLGSSYGFIIGNKHKFAVEISNFGLDYYKPTQISIGYIFTFIQ